MKFSWNYNWKYDTFRLAVDGQDMAFYVIKFSNADKQYHCFVEGSAHSRIFASFKEASLSAQEHYGARKAGSHRLTSLAQAEATGGAA